LTAYSSGALPSRSFAYRGLTVRVECPENAHLDWLAEFLSPAFAVTDAPSADCVVHVILDPRRYAEMLAQRAGADVSPALAFALDQGPVRLPSWRAADGPRVLCSEASGVLYVTRLEGGRIDVVSPPANDGLRGALMKAVRELAMTSSWGRSTLVLHAAAFSAGARAVLIGGPKNAGKTSLLIHALHAPEARYLSNDRIVLDVAAAAPVAHAMPTIVTVRPGTLARFPAAGRQTYDRYRYDLTTAEAESARPGRATDDRHRSLSPAQLCRLLGAGMTSHGVVAAVVFPRIGSAARGLALRRLGVAEAVARLPEALFAAHCAPYASEVFRPPAYRPVLDRRHLTEVWTRVAAHVPVFDCALGPHAYDDGTERVLVEQLLGP
jgi:hypothetical protein